MEDANLANLAARLEESRVQAMVNADVNKLKELFSDDLYYGHTAGYVDDKVSFLEKLSSGVYSYTFIKTQISNVRAIAEDGLVINGDLTIEINPAGEKRIFNAIYLAVWRQEAGNWRFLSLQAAFKK